MKAALCGIDQLQFEHALSLLNEARLTRREVFILGNGGSASTAEHFACDLMRNVGEVPIRAHALTANAALLTAAANDESYEDVFRRTLLALARPTDVLIVISASGSSPNVLAALHLGKALGLTSIALLGRAGRRQEEQAFSFATVSLLVQSADYGLIESAHSALCHLLTDELAKLGKL